MQHQYHGQQRQHEVVNPANSPSANQHDRDAGTRTTSCSEASVRKLTLSCSRCRASKLKCDRKEPCMECIKRNIGHLCTKDERQPRAKRVKTNQGNNDNTETNTSRNQDTEAEETAQVLERFVDGTSRINANPSAAFKPRVSSVAPDYPNTYWSNTNDIQRQGEEIALLQEIVDAMPELDIIPLLYEVFVTRCQGPLGNVVHTPTFMKQAEKFCDCLSLASPLAGVMAISRTFSMDTLASLLLALVLGLAFHPTPTLLAWSPTPLTLRVQDLRASDVYSKRWRSLAVHCIKGGLSLFCGSIAALQAAIMLLLDGQEGSLALDAILVTAISGAQKLGLHTLGDAKLEDVASQAVSSEDHPSTFMEPPHIRTEIGIRIWYALVMRDWSRGQALGYYSIHPSQFNTRIPLHINDEDLSRTTLKVNNHGHFTERPRSEFTMLSYTVHALEIAGFARESIDFRGPLFQAQRQEQTDEGAKMRVLLNKKYERFVAGLPTHFRLGSTVGLTSTGPAAAIPVHRWMLHQQLWSLFLRLHRGSLSSMEGRASCQLLAQNIVSTQAQIQARCAVCGSLSVSETQLFSAAIVLLLDLLFSSKHKDAGLSSAQLNRLMARDKIREAIELLRTGNGAEASPSLEDLQTERAKTSAQRSVIALEALMKLEEEESGDGEGSNGAKLRKTHMEGQGEEPDSRAWKSAQKRVIAILEALQGNVKKATAATEQASSTSFPTADMSLPLPTAAHGSQDLDVLPVLSNDSSSNFWEYLDFGLPQSPSQYGSFLAAADTQTLLGSMPSGPSSGVAESSSNFGTPGTTDLYSNTGGTRGSHTSPSSLYRADFPS